MSTAATAGLLDVLSRISDPRGRRGRRFSLSAMMATVVCGILCGHRGYKAIADWIALQDRKVWWSLGYWRKPPCANAFRDLMMALDPLPLEQALRGWVESQLGKVVDEAKLSAVAMDGKSLCGVLNAHGRTLHLLSLFDQETSYVLSQMEVDGKTNEITVAPQLLETIVLKGRVITGDALLCQREICQKIIDSGGHYLLVAKDNQPDLKNAIAAEFEAAFSPCNEKQRQAHLDTAETLNKGHGRRERRKLQTSTRLAEHLDWPGAAQVCRLDRTTSHKGVPTHEVAYAISSGATLAGQGRRLAGLVTRALGHRKPVALGS